MPRKPRSAKSQPRRPLTRERVIERAVAYADTQGVAKLSMRELARALDFGVMSLYNHVANKDEMLDGMVELVAEQISLPAPDEDDWKAALRGIAVSAHDTLMRHPWAAGLWSNRGPGPSRLRYNDAILGVLREAGFSVAEACRGFHAITTHVLGFTLQRLDFPVAHKDLESVARDFLEVMPTDEFPWFAEHVQHHVDAPDQGDSFTFVLDLILDGLEREAD